jgi:hypothetical protein
MKNGNNKKYLKMVEKRNRALSKEFKRIQREEFDEKIKALKLSVRVGENNLRSNISNLAKEISALEYDMSSNDNYAQVYGDKLSSLRSEYKKLTELLINYNTSQEVRGIEDKIKRLENSFQNIDKNQLIVNSTSTTLYETNIFNNESTITEEKIDNTIPDTFIDNKYQLEAGSVINNFIEVQNVEDTERVKITQDVADLIEDDVISYKKNRFKLFKKEDNSLNVSEQDKDSVELSKNESFGEAKLYSRDESNKFLVEEDNEIDNKERSSAEKGFQDIPIDSGEQSFQDGVDGELYKESGEKSFEAGVNVDSISVWSGELDEFESTQISEKNLGGNVASFSDLTDKNVDIVAFAKEEVGNDSQIVDQLPKKWFELFKKKFDSEVEGDNVELISIDASDKKTELSRDNQGSKQRFKFFKKRVKKISKVEEIEDLEINSDIDSDIGVDSYIEISKSGSYVVIEKDDKIAHGGIDTQDLDSIGSKNNDQEIEISTSSEEIISSEDYKSSSDSNLILESNNEGPKKKFKLFKKRENEVLKDGGYTTAQSSIEANGEIDRDGKEIVEVTLVDESGISGSERDYRIVLSQEPVISIADSIENKGVVQNLDNEEGTVSTGKIEKKTRFNKLKNIIGIDNDSKKDKFNPKFDIQITTANTDISEYDYSSTRSNTEIEEESVIIEDSGVSIPVSVNLSEIKSNETIYIEKNKKELKKERKAIKKELKRNIRESKRTERDSKKLEKIKAKEMAINEKKEQEELSKLEKANLKEIELEAKERVDAERENAKELRLAAKREKAAIKLAKKLAINEERNKKRLESREEKRKKRENKKEASLSKIDEEKIEIALEKFKGLNSDFEDVNLSEIKDNAVELFEENKLIAETPDFDIDKNINNASEKNAEDNDLQADVESKVSPRKFFNKKKRENLSEESLDKVSEFVNESTLSISKKGEVNVEYILDEDVENEKRKNFEENRNITNEKIKNIAERHKIKLDRQERKDKEKNDKLKAKAEKRAIKQLEKNRVQAEKDIANQQLEEIKRRSRDAIEAERQLYESESESKNNDEPKRNFLRSFIERKKKNKELKRSIREEIKQSQSDEDVNAAGDGSLSKEEKRRLKEQFKSEKERIKKARSEQIKDEKRKSREFSSENKRDKKIENADKNRLKVEREELKKSFKNTKKIEKARRREAKELAKIEEKRISALRKVESDNIKAANKIEAEKIKREKEYKKEILAQQKYKSKQQRSLLKEETKINKRAQKIELPKLKIVDTDIESNLGGSYQWDAESGVFSVSDSGSGINYMEYDLPEQLPRR